MNICNDCLTSMGNYKGVVHKDNKFYSGAGICGACSKARYDAKVFCAKYTADLLPVLTRLAKR